MIDLTPLDRHEKIALAYSGGKDSTAVLTLLEGHLDRITVYHLDTGDLFPEIRDHVRKMLHGLPHVVRIRGDVEAWIAEHGLPTDLLPFNSHPVAEAMGEARHKLVPRYECCWNNLMWPFFERVLADGNTLLIRGTKRADMAQLPAVSGQVFDNLEIFHPIEDWSDEQVRTFLAVHNIKLPILYDYFEHAPECARCSAWWHEGRARFLQQQHPELFYDYDARLQIVINEIALPLAMLRREAGVS
jgi:phosphoadenosine phosphosulfate reductase